MGAPELHNLHHNGISPGLLSSYPFLADYVSYLPPETQVMGEGAYGIVLDAEKYKRVYKIGNNSDNSESLQREYTHHVAFYLGSEEVKSENPGIYENFRIPQINESPLKFSSGNERLFLYEMEKINGNTLFSHMVEKIFRDKGFDFDVSDMYDCDIEDMFKTETGMEVNSYIRGNYSVKNIEVQKFIKKIKHGVIQAVGDPYTSYMFYKLFPEYYDAFADFLQKLKKKGLRHTDLHAKNIMISYDRDGKPIFYIIDFGIVEIHRH